MKRNLGLCSGLTLAGCLLVGQSGCARRAPALNPTAGERPAAHAQQAQSPGAGEPFKFPVDKGGELLSQLLRPGSQSVGDDGLREKLYLAPPPSVEHPELPLPTSQMAIVGPPEKKKPSQRPRALGEDAPLTAYRDDPLPPARRELASGARVSLASASVNVPVPLEFLGVLQFDRVPLDDPSTEASQQAVLAAGAPARTETVPFVPINLPDPFQNANTVRLRTPPKEDAEPSGSHPKLPPAPPK